MRLVIQITNRVIANYCFVVVALAAVFFTAPAALAHPLSQGVLDIVVNSDRITVRARVTIEEVQFTNSHTGEHPLPGPWAATGADAFQMHAEYLAAHLHFTADGKPLIGRVCNVMPPAETSDIKTASAVYELEYPFPVSSPPAAPPRSIGISQDTLADAHFAAGESWETLYFVTLSQAGRKEMPLQGNLSRNEPWTMVCEQPAASGKWELFKSYFVLGVEHILGQRVPGGGLLSRTDVGFDHLLFVTALVLSTRSLWDLFKVVSAFTLAHTITLTLAALKIINISPHITEPLISLSIVFVALQNVFWPDAKKGPFSLIAPFFSRMALFLSFGMAGKGAGRAGRRWVLSPILAAAFFFGLFHGLGFAGGLLETMQELKGPTVAVAIIAFSLGVEVGHQLVVVPIFGILKLVRQFRPTELARNRTSLAIQQVGSAAISLAGLFYLVVALQQSFSPAASAGIVAALVVSVIVTVMLTRVFVERRAAQERAMTKKALVPSPGTPEGLG